MSGGGVFKSLGNIGGNIVGGITPGNVVGSVVGSLGGLGDVVGPAIQLASGANPLGVFGASLAGRVAKDYMQAGGDTDKPIFIDSAGNPVYATPGADYGSTTYRLKKNALDADKFFIEGEKGIYNLLPELAPLYGDKNAARRAGVTSYNVYQDIYNRFGDDEKAKQQFAERYGPKTLDVNWSRTDNLDNSLHRLRSGKVGGYDLTYAGDQELSKWQRRDLKRTAREMEQELRKSLPKWDPKQYANKAEWRAARQTIINNYNPQDLQYVDWGFGKKATKKEPWEAVANYAAKKNNPFFIPFAPSPAPAPAPASAPAPALEAQTQVQPQAAQMASGGRARQRENYSYTTEANRALNMPTNQGQVFEQLQRYYAPMGTTLPIPGAPSKQQMRQVADQIASTSSAYQNTAGEFGTLYDNLVSGRVKQGDVNKTLSRMQELSKTAAGQYKDVNRVFENPMFGTPQTIAGMPQQRNTLGLNPARRFTLPKETWNMKPEELARWIQKHEKNAGKDSFMGNAAWVVGPALIGGAGATGLTGITGPSVINSAIGSGIENLTGMTSKASGGIVDLIRSKS